MRGRKGSRVKRWQAKEERVALKERGRYSWWRERERETKKEGERERESEEQAGTR